MALRLSLPPAPAIPREMRSVIAAVLIGTATLAGGLATPASAQEVNLKCWEAAKAGDTKIVKQCLADGVSPDAVNQLDYPSWSMLLISVRRCTKTVKTLVEAGADTSIKSPGAFEDKSLYEEANEDRDLPRCAEVADYLASQGIK